VDAFDSTRFSKLLIAGAQALDFPLDNKQVDALLAYLSLFIKWNKAYNLSAIRQPEEMLYKHLLDSLSIAHALSQRDATRIIDVGTGPGLPGVPLAICFPQRNFTLLDSAGKKTRFLFQAAQSLKLTNITIENRRVEQFQPTQSFDIVLSRAFASLADMTRWCSHLVDENGEFWAMKGVFPHDELSQVEKHYKVDTCTPLAVPGEIGERCLLTIKHI